jgi:hypothetical protein
MSRLLPYAKAVVAALAAVVIAVNTALADDAIQLDEVVNIVVAFVSVIGVFALRNRPAPGIGAPS